MILEQDPETGYWNKGFHTHLPQDCADHPCAIHNTPSDHPLKDAKLNWRGDKAVLERICEHGIGHDDIDAVNWHRSLNTGDWRGKGIHGCDGCCFGNYFGDMK